jgi:hypothetical protein
MTDDELEEASDRAQRLLDLRRARLELAADAKRELARLLTERGALEGDVADAHAFLEEVIAGVLAAGFPIYHRGEQEGGVQVQPWGSFPHRSELVANLEWTPRDLLIIDDGFPVLDLVKPVTQAVGAALEVQGFEVTEWETEILVRPGSTRGTHAGARPP